MASELELRQERVLQYLAAVYPKGATYAELEGSLHIRPRPQLAHVMQSLLKAGRVRGEKTKTRKGVFWSFYALHAIEAPPPPAPAPRLTAPGERTSRPELNLADLAGLPEETRLRRTLERAMNAYFGEQLARRALPGLPGYFSLVSADGCTAGEGLVYEVVQSLKASPARLAPISEKVWLLEKSPARVRFLAFGGDRRVPMDWLVRYAHLTAGISFFYVHEDGVVELLK